MENFCGAVCNCRISSGQSFVSISKISCSTSSIIRANQGAVADGTDKRPFCWDPLPRNGRNVVVIGGFDSFVFCVKNIVF